MDEAERIERLRSENERLRVALEELKINVVARFKKQRWQERDQNQIRLQLQHTELSFSQREGAPQEACHHHCDGEGQMEP